MAYNPYWPFPNVQLCRNNYSTASCKSKVCKLSFMCTSLSKCAKIRLSKQTFYAKNYLNLSDFFFNLEWYFRSTFFVKITFWYSSIFQTINFLKSCLIFFMNCVHKIQDIKMVSFRFVTFNQISFYLQLCYMYQKRGQLLLHSICLVFRHQFIFTGQCKCCCKTRFWMYRRLYRNWR